MSNYILSDSLQSAIEIALYLNRPLLLCGEPGTGKTTLAKEMARRFSAEAPNGCAKFYPKPLVFNTKTTSAANDLFYSYDALSRLRDAYAKSDTAVENYIHLNALGKAIVLKHSRQSDSLGSIKDLSLFSEKNPLSDYLDAPVSSIVLIDEIDKAPRDFPNDILNEIENFEFDIREMKASVDTIENNAKIFVIMTSNNEKSLPDAFLRRCIFHYIDFPKDQLIDILKVHFTNWKNEDDIKAVTAKFNQLRDLPLNKKPATAEYINWVQYLSRQEMLDTATTPFSKLYPEDQDKWKSSLGILFKNKNDYNQALEALVKM